jgi:uncharacterized Zn-finger protein
MNDKIPEVIYLQWYGLDEKDMHDAKIECEMRGQPFPDPVERTWCVDRQYDTDVVYKRVRKKPTQTCRWTHSESITTEGFSANGVLHLYQSDNHKHFEITDLESDDWTHCPYCGKPIEIIGGQG